MSAVQLMLGDCLSEMRRLADASVHAVVTDPPYGIGFMGKAWDGADIEKRAAARRASTGGGATGENGAHRSSAVSAGIYNLAPAGMRAFQEFSEEWAREAFRVLKPGGYMLSFASPRTYHRMTVGIEDAGFEVRDQIMWVFGSGFPKSKNGDWGGTALKPAHEPVVLARKPLVGTVAKNWAEHETGGLNIDACRVGYGDMSLDEVRRQAGSPGSSTGVPRNAYGKFAGVGGAPIEFNAVGRWPANLIHDGSDEVLAMFPEAPGQIAKASSSSRKTQNTYGAMARRSGGQEPRDAGGSAARFFYCAKASRADRNDGVGGGEAPAVATDATPRDCETADWPARNGNHHPTVKPTDLMRYLVRLVTPPGGVVLDPFMGSGSTGRAAVLEGLGFIGIEREVDYWHIAQARIEAATRMAEEAANDAAIDSAQQDLFGDAA